ncbi:MAG: hypothetical protein GX147_01470 [Deltaproteobacteria bacterium]|nr:hypothetical protein [Deltaproteobacteria bacterium]
MRKKDKKQISIIPPRHAVPESDQLTTPAKVVTVAVLTGVFAYTIYDYLSEVSRGGNPWCLSDWLVNYSSGFALRGACGEFALFLSKNMNLDLLWTVATIQSILLLLVYFLILLIFCSFKRSSVELMILFSPVLLLFPLYDPLTGLRKEILVYIPFLLYIWSLLKGKLSSYIVMLVPAMYAFALFSHELAVFVLPFFLLLTFLFFHLQIIEERRMYLLMAFFVIPTVVTLVCMFVFMGRDTTDMCNQLISNGINPSYCTKGSLLAFDHYAHGPRSVVNHIFERFYLFTYGAAFVLALLPFFFMQNVNIPKKYFVAFPIGAFLFMLPLYIFAIDWGRWVHIYIFFLSTLVFALAPLGYLKPRMKVPVILIVAYAMLWSMHHCCFGGLGIGAGYLVNNLLYDIVKYSI